MIYLRLEPKTVPVRYTETVEKAGLVVSEKHSIALYTCKTGPRQGPTGPPGEDGVDQNSWFDCIIAAVTDNESPISVGALKETWRAPYPLDLTLGYIRISLIEAPVGGDFIVDLHMNGATMFSTLLRVDDGMKTSVGSAIPAVLSTLYIPDDAEFQPYVTQVGVSNTGVGCKFSITGIKTV